MPHYGFGFFRIIDSAAKENAASLILSLAEIAVGILLLINPVGFTAGIIIAAGVLLLALGLRMMVRYFTTNPGMTQQEQSLALAAISILFALLIFMNPFGTTVALWTFTAITLIVEAVLDVVYFILTVRRGKEERAGR